MNIARIIVTVAFAASVYTLGRVADISASQPYGWPGVAIHHYLGAH
jgi:hypothetical protein